MQNRIVSKYLIFIVLTYLLMGEKPLGAQHLEFVHHHDDSVRHVFSITMDDNQLTEIHRPMVVKIDISASDFIYNGKKYVLEEIELHGQTTLEFRRKSYTISLDKKMSFRTKEGYYKFKNFYLISMSMDKNYFRNSLSFHLLNELGLFELVHDYVNLIINGKNEGVFLLLQRPQDWALKRIDSPYIIRRDYGKGIDKEKYSKDLSEESVVNYRNQFKLIYQYAEKYKGKALYRKLNKVLDLKEYYKWLAFNYWLMNGDYTDELYLYIDPETDIFRPLPWDYDDIFSVTPHEGNTKRLRPLNNDFMFSIQEPLDRYLIQDNYCYERYKETLYTVMKSISSESLGKEIEMIYSELYPYYNAVDIIGQTRYDKYDKTDLNALETEMTLRYGFMIERRRDILENLGGQLSKKFLANHK
ncbi:CotH kinase family protein [Bacteroidota bacterium]